MLRGVKKLDFKFTPTMPTCRALAATE